MRSVAVKPTVTRVRVCFSHARVEWARDWAWAWKTGSLGFSSGQGSHMGSLKAAENPAHSGTSEKSRRALTSSARRPEREFRAGCVPLPVSEMQARGSSVQKLKGGIDVTKCVSKDHSMVPCMWEIAWTCVQ